MISVVIPTFNMEGHLPALWESICASGLSRIAGEILFVNDGSTDSTAATIDTLRAGPGPESSKVRTLDLESNRGRFLARYHGARAAQGDQLLFLDSRLNLGPSFGASIDRIGAKHPCLVASVDIDTSRNIFCLYWERSHRAIFRRHYRDAARLLILTPENYDQYLKGTTAFLCPRDVFIECCEPFVSQPLLNDDTHLMKEIVRRMPIAIHPEVRIGWIPREDWKSFLWRLWDRGPSFVEYHVFEHRGPFFWAVLAGLAGVIGLGTLMFLDWKAGLAALASGLALALLSTLAFTRTPLELLKLAPLHLGVLLAFGFGVIRGLWVNIFRAHPAGKDSDR